MHPDSSKHDAPPPGEDAWIIAAERINSGPTFHGPFTYTSTATPHAPATTWRSLPGPAGRGRMMLPDTAADNERAPRATPADQHSDPGVDMSDNDTDAAVRLRDSGVLSMPKPLARRLTVLTCTAAAMLSVAAGTAGAVVTRTASASRPHT